MEARIYVFIAQIKCLRASRMQSIGVVIIRELTEEGFQKEGSFRAVFRRMEQEFVGSLLQAGEEAPTPTLLSSLCFRHGFLKSLAKNVEGRDTQPMMFWVPSSITVGSLDAMTRFASSCSYLS